MILGFNKDAIYYQKDTSFILKLEMQTDIKIQKVNYLNKNIIHILVFRISYSTEIKKKKLYITI